MESKACEEEKPQQPVGCEDFDDEHNALSAYLCKRISGAGRRQGMYTSQAPPGHAASRVST